MAVPKQNYLELEPHTRTVATWTPASVRGALRLLENGNFTRASYLADAIMGDDRVQATLGTRVNGVLGLPLLFDPAGEKRQEKKAAELLSRSWWDIAPESALDQLLSYGRLLGAVLAELVWDTDAGEAIPAIKVWHPSLLRFDTHERHWKLHLESQELIVTPGDGKWLLYAPYGARRPWTKALVRALAIPWLAKQYAIGDWQRYSEIHGSPTRVGTASPGAKPDDRHGFLDDLSSLASDSAIVLPEGYDLKMVEAASKSHEGFERLIDWANKAIAVAILGQNLTTEVEGGSLAAARVHENVRLDLVRSDTESLSTTLREQLVAWWAEFNLGDRQLAPWPRWQADPPEDLAQEADTYLKLSQALDNLVGVGVDVAPILEKYGLQALAGELKPKEPQQMRLASGDRPGRARGFIRGQLYADALAEAAARAPAPNLAELSAVIERSDDYASLQANLRQLYQQLDATDFAEVMEKALILADLAGRYAVQEDS